MVLNNDQRLANRSVWARRVPWSAALVLLGGCARGGVTDRSVEVEAAPSALADTGSLPQLGKLQGFELLDQSGAAFSPEVMRGKVWVAAFMFTRCPTVCPLMTARMRSLQQSAAQRGLPLQLVSFSVDPDNDTPEVLRAYARTNELDTGNWRFVTGDSTAIRQAAERGFKIGVEGEADPGAPDYGITHGTHLVLVDSSLNLRGYYQSSEPKKVEQLLDDVARLGKPG